MNSKNLPLKGLNVLVVDDDVDSVVLLRIVLEEYGCNVVSAYSAQEALATLCQWQPHVLISDLAMPLVDGVSLVQQIQLFYPRLSASLKKIAVTAYLSPQTEEQIWQSGFHALLKKPIDSEIVAQVVRDYTLTV